MKLRQARDIWLATPGPLRLSILICLFWLAINLGGWLLHLLAKGL